MNRVTELLGSRYPIIQGAMAVISNPELVAAVSAAGGFGLLATAFATDKEILRGQIRRTKELTDCPFGANLFMKNPMSIEFARLLADEGVRMVTVSGGSPKTLVPILAALGIGFVAVTSTVRAAVGAANLGALAVVAEGSESGGFQGFHGCSTLVLVPQVVDAVDVPVIAAGGISDARTYKAALALGAEGVQVGTRFIASHECKAHQDYKEAIIKAGDSGTVLIAVGGAQLRSLRTPLAERVLTGEVNSQSFFGPQAMKKSFLSDDPDAGLLPAGQVAGSIGSILSVKQIIDDMVNIQ